MSVTLNLCCHCNLGSPSPGYLYSKENLSWSEYSYFIVDRAATSVGRASDSRAKGPGFDTRSGHIHAFLFPLIQEGQLSVTGESMCTTY